MPLPPNGFGGTRTSRAERDGAVRRIRTDPSDLFEAIEREIEEMDRRFDAAMEELRRQDWSQVPPERMAFYGWTFEVDPDGVPHVHEFGNVRPGQPLLGAAREPVVSRVRDEARGETHVTVELPGVEKEDVRLDATPHALTLRAGSGERAFAATVELDAPIDPASVKATCRNGVLDVTAKPGEPGEAERRVRVE